MTTVVFHNGRMVSDARSTYADTKEISSETVQKIRKINGSLFGFAGDVQSMHEFINCLTDGIQPPKYLGKNISVLEWDGKFLYRWQVNLRSLNLFSSKESSFVYGRKKIGGKKKFAAIGSGTKYAEKAFSQGRNLEDCVKYAAQNDKGTNENIWVATLKEIITLFNKADWPDPSVLLLTDVVVGVTSSSTTNDSKYYVFFTDTSTSYAHCYEIDKSTDST